MKYIYTDISDLKISFQMSLHDIERLSEIMTGVESIQYKWFLDQFKETLRESRLRCADELESNAKLIRKEAKEVENV